MFDSASYSANAFTSFLLIIVIADFILLVLSLRKSKKPIYRYFSLVILLTFIYMACYFMQTMAHVLSVKIIWANIRVMALSFTPLVWVIVTALATQGRMPARWMVTVLFSVAVLNIIVLWTDGYHHMFRVSPELYITPNGVSVIKSPHGVWYFSVYSLSLYIPIAITGMMFFNAFTRSYGVLKMQYGTQLAAIVISLLSGLPFMLQMTLIDTYAVTTAFTTFLHYMVIYRYKLTDVVPIAKNTITDLINDLLFIYNAEGRLVEMNRFAKEQTEGCETTKTMTSICETLKLDRTDESIYGKTLTVEKDAPDGTRWLYVDVQKMKGGYGEILGYMVYIRDMTEQEKRIRLENEMAILNHKKQMLDDIHDGISGSITIISMLAGQKFDSYEEIQETMRNIEEISSDTGKEIRLMMESYRRDVPDIERLSNDMRYIGNLYTQSMPIEFVHKESIAGYETGRITFSTYIKYVHFMKESVINAVKHSGASKVESSLSIADNIMTIVIRDNGKGYDTSAKSDGHGLRNMRTHIDAVGGELKVVSGQGTEITATIPLN